MAAPVLEVSGARVFAGPSLVLREASLLVEEPGVYLLLGPNGAGKTSLLSAIAGRAGYRLEGGTARYLGRPLAGMSLLERARGGLVLGYQSPPPLRGLRVEELVREVARVYGAPGGAASYAYEALGLGRLLRRPVSGLSGGERKRLELYLVLLQRPRLALLDEPDSGVDVDTLDTLADVVARAVGEGVAVLLASHTLGFMERLVVRGLVRGLYLAHRGRVAPLAAAPGEALRVLRVRGLQGLTAHATAG